jgi:S1-C subfamily serine protease
LFFQSGFTGGPLFNRQTDHILIPASNTSPSTAEGLAAIDCVAECLTDLRDKLHTAAMCWKHHLQLVSDILKNGSAISINFLRIYVEDLQQAAVESGRAREGISLIVDRDRLLDTIARK